MIRLFLLIVLLYLLFYLIKNLIKFLLSPPNVSKNETQKRRRFDENDIEDIDFEEIKKEK